MYLLITEETDNDRHFYSSLFDYDNSSYLSGYTDYMCVTLVYYLYFIINLLHIGKVLNSLWNFS